MISDEEGHRPDRDLGTHNRANLEDNILPTRPRATLILKTPPIICRDGGAAATVVSVVPRTRDPYAAVLYWAGLDNDFLLNPCGYGSLRSRDDG